MAEVSKVDKFSFLAEWFDSEASIIRKYYLSFFPSDSTVEMFDIKNHKLFLKRTVCNNLSAKDIFVGNTIKIFSRQIKIVDYADSVTRKKMEVSMQSEILANDDDLQVFKNLKELTELQSFAMIKPDGIVHKGEILCNIYHCGFQISQMKMTKLDKDRASELYKEHEGQPYLASLLDHVTSGAVIGIDLLAADAVQKLIDLVGPSDPSEAKTKCPGSIRAQFGQDISRNVIHVANSAGKAEMESAKFFESCRGAPPLKPLVNLINSTCCIIKPHAVQEGLVGKIICMIEQNGFLVSGLQLFYLDEMNAEEFLEIYKGVVPDYMSMVKQLSSGACVAMEITSENPNCDVPAEFRQFVGPSDPEVAKRIRPNTIRACFGKTKVENAVHVTDLPEDAVLEVEYFFKILPS